VPYCSKVRLLTPWSNQVLWLALGYLCLCRLAWSWTSCLGLWLGLLVESQCWSEGRPQLCSIRAINVKLRLDQESRSLG
jgi:hypothetical protein